MKSQSWLAIITLAALLAGCESDQQAANYPMAPTFQQQVSAIVARAVATEQAEFDKCDADPQLDTHIERAKCRTPVILQLFRDVQFPDMDLVYVFTSNSEAWSEAIDRGTMTETEVRAKAAEGWSTLFAEAERRNLQRRQLDLQVDQARREALFQNYIQDNLSARPQPEKPRSPDYRCYGNAGYLRCSPD